MDNLSTQTSSHDVIYTLRTVHQHQTQLLILADQKANILTGIVAIVLTILITNAKYLNGYEQFLFSFSGFLAIELSALVMAILVVLPRTRHKTSLNIEEMQNPFFFGSFTKFNEHDYLDFISRNITNDEQARSFLARDLFQIGCVLKKKYRLLRMAYLLAVAGILFLICSVSYTFLISFIPAL